MKILVTGGAGFIGSNLVDRLIELGHSVMVVDNLSTGKRSNLHPKAEFSEMDITDPKLSEIFDEFSPECVFHLAAQVDVRKSVQDPMHDARSNILGTIHLLDLSTRYKIKKFIFSSSGGVIYGETPEPAGEETAPNPISPYGVAKLAGEGYITCFGEWNNLDYSILRYANVYGPRQDPKGEAGVVSIFIGQLVHKEKSVLYGNGELERDYIYVDDVVRANVLCIEKGSRSTYNIGTGISTSVKGLYHAISETTKTKNEIEFAPKRPGELERNVLDCKKAKRDLGWEPGTDLKKGLEKTYQWFVKK
jgi:UDP-glucose 4-epimerase